MFQEPYEELDRIMNDHYPAPGAAAANGGGGEEEKIEVKLEAGSPWAYHYDGRWRRGEVDGGEVRLTDRGGESVPLCRYVGAINIDPMFSFLFAGPKLGQSGRLAGRLSTIYIISASLSANYIEGFVGTAPECVQPVWSLER